MADALSPEDAAALDRLREHLRGLGDASARVSIERIGGAWRCEASASVRSGQWHSALAVSAWQETAGGAICEAGRLCGVAL